MKLLRVINGGYNFERVINCWIFRFVDSSRSVSKEDRASLSEQDATEEKEAEDELHQVADRRIGETFSQTKVSGIG